MKLQDLYEATIGGAHIDSAMSKIISYLQRSLGAKLIRIPGVEHFKNSKETGWGMRYVVDGSTQCIRFNWKSEPSAGKSNSIVSIDVFNGRHDPSIHLRPDGISLVKILPALAGQLVKPKMGSHPVFASSPEKEEVTEGYLTEAKKGDFTYESALLNFLTKMSKGKTLTRSDWIMSYHISTVDAFDTLVSKFAEKLDIQGKRFGLKPDVEVEVLYRAVLANCDGHLEVTAGGTGEDYLETDQENVDPAEHVSFSDSITHLEGLVQGLIKKSFNALFVAGKGGTGKTQTVEDTLHSNGLRDGDGYFKNTGTASAIGIYTLLYEHRKEIILFDDSDGALGDQDARNLIKAATDTKKIRKLVWNKKSSNMFDPDSEEGKRKLDDEDPEDDSVPKYFNFEGQIIFISNLSLDKLDPDKALRTRAFVIAINPTAEELMQRMEEILHQIPLEDGLSLTKKERVGVLDVIKSGKRKEDVSLRTLVRALNLAASGASNWEQLVKLYA